MDYLQDIPVSVLIVDTSIEPRVVREHHRQVLDMVHEFADEWQLVGVYSPNRDGTVYPDAIQVYALSTNKAASASEIKVDLGYTLGREIRGRVDTEGGGSD